MRKILMIGTGGTIASAVTESGLAPELTTSQLLEHLPQVSGICQVECLQLLNLDSTNVGPQHWKRMSRCIRENYEAYDGFVITHGTDTMTYSAAALSYMIQQSPKPIVFTAPRSPWALTLPTPKSISPMPCAAPRRTCRGCPSSLTGR